MSSGAPARPPRLARRRSVRTIEVLDQRGIADRFLSEGQEAQVAAFAGTPLDIGDFPTRHPYGLGLWQNHIERILADWVDEPEVPIHREREVTGFAQGDTGVDVELSDGRPLPTDYLVGCDGGRSVIRKAAGIEFPGWDATTSALIAQVEMTEERVGYLAAMPLAGMPWARWTTRSATAKWSTRKEGTVGVMLTESHVGSTVEPTFARSQRGARRRLRDRLRDPQSHMDLPVHRHDSAGRDGRAGRVLLAGETRRTCTPRSVDRASTPACRMR